MANERPYATIPEYIAQFEGATRAILERTYQTIRAAAPDAEERIGYHMPCFWQGRPLIYFAAMKSHLGIYPTPNGIEHFADRLAGYKTSKGAVQFPYNKPIDYDLIAEITRLRVSQTETA